MRTERFHPALSSPLFIAAVGLLLLNDIHLKPAFPGFITGKLSDVAGLFAFPFFFALFLPKQKLPIYIATTAGFLLWKLPVIDGGIALANSILPYAIGRVCDYSDYWALLVLPASYFYRPRPVAWGGRPVRIGIACIACLAFCATSRVPGHIMQYSYLVPEAQLRNSVDSVFASDPGLMIPRHLFDSLGFTGYPGLHLGYRSYPEIDTRGYYFGCHIADTSGPEIFIMEYSYNSDEDRWGINLVAAGIQNQLKTEHVLDDDEEERLIRKFEEGFIAKLGAYIKPVPLE